MSVQNGNKVPLDEINRQALRLKENSEDAFTWIYKQFSRPIYRFCLRMLGDAELAKDAYQDVFVRVFEHAREFRGENFPAWIYTIARRVCLNMIRARKPKDSFDEITHSTAETEQEDVFLMMHIRRAIDSLSHEFREALILREYEGLSYEQIASVVGIDVSLAKVRVHRARLVVRKLLSPIVNDRYESR